jgi:VanZ family protein
LFVPLGLLGTLMWRRPVLVLAACVALTFLLETWQSLIGRMGDATDVLHNAVGAALGVGVALLSGQFGAQRRRDERG